MVFRGTKLRVVDNSGAVFARCIGLFKKNIARVGDVISVTLIKVLPRRRVRRKQIFRAIIVKTCRKVSYLSCVHKSYDSNAIVLLKKKEFQMVRTRIIEPISSNLRNLGFSRFLTLAPRSFLTIRLKN